jgi:hypothetical protein
MPLEILLTCPLGHKCEEAKDGKIYRCAWYTQLAGRNPNTGEVLNEFGCAIAWLPVLQVETAGVSRGTSAAVESLRNVVAGTVPPSDFLLPPPSTGV